MRDGKRVMSTGVPALSSDNYKFRQRQLKLTLGDN
jgi:hypothetical protein